MKAFVFAPTNEFVAKISIHGADVEDAIRRYVAETPTLPVHSYVEAGGKVWTVLSREPLRLEPSRLGSNAAGTAERDAGGSDQAGPAVPFAISVAGLGFALTLMTPGWLMVLAFIPLAILCVIHVLVHACCHSAARSPGDRRWFVWSNVLLFGGFMLWCDTGDSSDWLTITALIYGRGSFGARAPDWVPDTLWWNVIIFVPYMIVTTWLLRRRLSASRRLRRGQRGVAPLVGILMAALVLLPCTSADAVPPVEDSAPCRVHQRVPVRFPPRVLSEGILHGEARLLLDVDSTGQLVDVLVIGYTRREFADAALEAVTEWRFTPARVAGEAASSTITLNIKFNTAGVHAYVKQPLGSEEPALSAGEQFVYGPASPAALDAMPSAIRRPRPMYLREWIEGGRTGTVTVEFYIDDKGRVRFPTIVGPADEYLGAAAIDAVKRWLFRPPTMKGRAVLTRVQQVFHFDPKGSDESDHPTEFTSSTTTLPRQSRPDGSN